jgi:hypothetical protein
MFSSRLRAFMFKLGHHLSLSPEREAPLEAMTGPDLSGLREQLMRERRGSSPCKRAAAVRRPSTQADSHTSAHGQDVWPRRLARGLMDAGPYPE